MPSVPFGEGTLNLTILSTAVRPPSPSATLPQEFLVEGPPSSREDLSSLEEGLSPEERRDLEAFRQTGWLFLGVGERDREPGARRQPAGPRRAIGDGRFLYGDLCRGEDGGLIIQRSRIVILFRAGTGEETIQRLFEERGLTCPRRLLFAWRDGQELPLYEVDLPMREGRSLQEVWEEERQCIESHPEVEWVEAELEEVPGDQEPAVSAKAFNSSDPHLKEQWQWKKEGTCVEDLWDRSCSPLQGEGIQVAILDKNFDIASREIQPGIIQAAYFDAAEDLIAASPTSISWPGNHNENHGTACATLVGGRRNNGRGGCGAAPECSMQVIALGLHTTTQVIIARAVAWAADPRTESPTADPEQSADLLSCSIGKDGPLWRRSRTLDLALSFAATRGRRRANRALGAAVFWASPNWNVEISCLSVSGDDDTIAVSAMDRHHDRFESGYGPRLDFLAPGVDIGSMASSGYFSHTGTSFATPCAAGVAAVVLQAAREAGRDLAATELRTILRESCEVKKGASQPNYESGWGWIHAVKAVAMVEGTGAVTLPGLLNPPGSRRARRRRGRR